MEISRRPSIYLRRTTCWCEQSGEHGARAATATHAAIARELACVSSRSVSCRVHTYDDQFLDEFPTIFL